MRNAKRALVTLAATGVIFGAPAAAFGEPPKGQGYFKNVQGGGAGESECAGPHQDQLPKGQGKKCD